MTLPLVALALLISWLIRTEYRKNFEYTPHNDPSSFYTQGTRKARTLVCVGDSLTCGNASYNYVTDLSGALAPLDFDVVNAGINGSHAKTALDRIDSVLCCKPTHVSILLGSNDIPCALNKIKQREYVRSGRIPAGYDVSIESYLEDLRSIVRKLKSVDGVQVFLCSPPVIGEDLQHEANRAIAGLLDELKEIAGASRFSGA